MRGTVNFKKKKKGNMGERCLKTYINYITY